MIPLWLFIAWRFVTAPHTTNSMRVAAWLSCISIAVGSCSLALIISVMNGFEKTTLDKFQSLHADIIMQQYGADLNLDAIESVISQEFPEIISISPYSTQQCSLLHMPTEQASAIITLKGILPDKEQKTTKLPSTITKACSSSFTSIFENAGLLIGNKLAERLECSVNDNVTLVYTPDTIQPMGTLTLAQRTVRIGGIFKSGIEEFDESMAYCSLSLLQELFPETNVQALGMQRTAVRNEQELLARLHARFSMNAYSWKELYPSLISALILEKYAMIVIVSLVLLIAVLSIFSLLAMHIQIKKTDIALLHALGMQPHDIQRIFIAVGTLLGLLGTLCGLLLAWLIGYGLERFAWISLPDSYFATHLPIHMQLHIFVAIFIITMLLCLGATLLPVRMVRSLHIAQVLKYR